MICPAQHTQYQPTDAEWRCPKCNADNTRFIIESTPEDALDDCSKLHEQDTIVCIDGRGMSHYETTGKRFAARLAKRANLVPCPHCKGRGMVAGAQESKAP